MTGYCLVLHRMFLIVLSLFFFYSFFLMGKINLFFAKLRLSRFSSWGVTVEPSSFNVPLFEDP